MSYRNLIRDLKSIVDDGLLDRKQDMNLATTHTNWELGKRIVKDEQDGEQRASYGKQILEKVADELKKQYGRGYGIANLRYMRQFFQLYKKSAISEKLNWSHYRLLAQVKDKVTRKQLERKVIKSGLSQRELAFELRRLQKGDLDLDHQGKLERPTGEIGIVRIRHILENGMSQANLDLGFHIWVELEDDIYNQMPNKVLVTVERNSSNLEALVYDGSRTNLWLYKARLAHVTDGDTIVVNIECGLGIKTQQILRLRAVDTAPLSTDDGIKARDFVERSLQDASFLIIKTRQRDKYARYIADVLVGKAGQSVEDVLKNGFYLNQELLDHGLGVRAGLSAPLESLKKT